MTPNRAQARESELDAAAFTMSDQILDLLARARSREIQLETAFGECAAESVPLLVGT